MDQCTANQQKVSKFHVSRTGEDNECAVSEAFSCEVIQPSIKPFLHSSQKSTRKLVVSAFKYCDWMKVLASFKIRIQAFKVRIQAFKIRIQAFKVRIQALNIRIQAFKIRIQAFKIRIQAFKIRIQA